MSKVVMWVAALMFCAAWWSVFVSFWAFVVLLVVSMLLAILAEFVDRQARDVGYSDTVFGSRPDVVAASVIYLDDRRPVWPNEAGAVE